MEIKDFADIVQIFFQFGPFAILPFLLIFTLPRLYKRLKSASKDIKSILKRNILMYQILIGFLIVVCVGYWIFYLSGPTFYYGEILDLDTKDYEIKSPHLHLKTITVEDEAIIKWIWMKEKGDVEAKINFVRGKAGTPEKTFYIFCDKIKRSKCRLIYKENDGELFYQDIDEPLSREHKTAENNLIRGIGFGIPVLYASIKRERINVDRIMEQLQAVDFTVRNHAIESVIKLASDSERSVIFILKESFNILKEMRGLSPIRQKQMYNPEYLFSSLLDILNRLPRDWPIEHEWSYILDEDSFDLIVESAGSHDPQLSNLALDFLSRFGEKEYELVREKVNDEHYQNNYYYTRGVINFASRLPDRNEYLKSLQRRPWIQERQDLLGLIEENLRILDFKLPDDLGEKKRHAIDTALRLNEMNVNYKWGGRNEEQGFDSAGFIAYILLHTEIKQAMGLVDPKKSWNTRFIRVKVGKQRPTNHPEEIGDLVFYKGGYVMLYLGDNKIIGMTEGGIIISDYREFRDEPFQVNKVIYE